MSIVILSKEEIAKLHDLDETTVVISETIEDFDSTNCVCLDIGNYIPVADIIEAYKPPENDYYEPQSWQAMNKGQYSKKQRRGKL